MFGGRQLLHDIYERGYWLRHYCLSHDDGYRSLERGGWPAFRSVAGGRECATAAADLEQPLPLHSAAPNAHAGTARQKRRGGAAGWPDGLGADSLA
ncbi:hypothetical protein D3C71_1380510 [compost metagenome]